MRHTQSLKRIWRTASEIAAREHATALGVTLDILWCFVRYGATRDNYAAFDFIHARARDRAKFVSFVRSRRLEKRLNDPAMKKEIFDKRGFLKNYSEFIGREWLALDESSDEEIRAFLRKHDIVVHKNEHENQGKGVRFLKSAELLSNAAAFAKLRKPGAGTILEEYIVQHAEMAKINPTTVQSVRVNTLIDRDGNVKIIGVRLMAGIRRTSNTHNGGVQYPVDEKTGRVYAWGIKADGEKILVHPTTGLFMPGFQIPMWPQILEIAGNVALRKPGARRVGWDFAVTPVRPILLEGNFGSGMESYQGWERGGLWDCLRAQV